MGHHDDTGSPGESGTRAQADAEIGTPAIARWLDHFPELRNATRDVLVCARRVRLVTARALRPGGPPPPASGGDLARAEAELGRAVDDVVRVARQPGRPRPSDAAAAIRRLAAAVVARRLEGQAFSPGRSTSDPTARRELFENLSSFGRSWRTLEQLAAEHHARRIPWQLELATHVSPTTPASELEIEGYALPLVPATKRHWGETCSLSGQLFHTDSRGQPTIRFRSLDCWHHVLSPPYHAMLTRVRNAIDRLAGTAPDAIRDLTHLCPFVFADYARELGNPTFLHLGLLDYPALAVALNNLLITYGDRPFLGRRDRTGERSDPGLGGRPDRETGDRHDPFTSYAWQTFASVRDDALRLARVLQDQGLRAGDRLGIVTAENAPEFYLADFAAVFSNLVSIGLGAGLGGERLARLSATAGLRAIVADSASASVLSDVGITRLAPALKTLIVFGAPGKPLPELPGIGVHRFEELLEAVGRTPAEWHSPSGVAASTPVIYDDQAGKEIARSNGIVPDADDSVYAVIFSSGTTGEPKGTVITRRRWAEEMFLDANVWPHVAVSFLPSSLMADRASLWRALNSGGRVGFLRTGAAMARDLRGVRPTLLDAPPAVWSSLLAPFKAATSPGVHRTERAAGRAAARASLGGRLAWAAIGGAPSEATLRLALEELLGVPVVDGYGTTETGQIAAGGRICAGVDFRLVDVPELGLSASAEPPRGELAVKTLRTEGRYFADEAASRTHFTEDGFFLTGDLVELGPDGACRVIGRRRHAFKLAGGEFVSPEELESRYLTSELVEAVFVTGSPGAPGVVAIVVPNRADLSEREVHASLRRIAARDGLRPIEVPVAVIVEPRRGSQPPWSPENGLLTRSLKPARHALERHYQARVAEAYARIDQWRADGGSLSGDEDPAAATALVLELAAVSLGCAPADLDLARSFADQGGDSMSALEFALRLEGLGVGDTDGEDPSDLLRRPLADLAGLVLARVKRAGSGAGAPEPACLPPPPHARPGGEPHPAPPPPDNATMASADAGDWPHLGHLPPRSGSESVLLTGATGFLGVHLLNELGGLLPAGARLVAIVRADSHEEARDRLRSSLAAADLQSPPMAVPGEANGARITAVAGRLERDHFGLDDADWRRLTDEIGLIVHAAAEVRPGPDYRALRASNVTATRNLLALATTGALKAFHLISSLNVALLVEDVLGTPAREESLLPPLLPPNIAGRHPAYAVTKWVSERLVAGVSEAIGHGFAASVSRPALLTWSSQTGYANRADWLTRVLESCLELRAAIGDSTAGVPSFAPVTETSARGLDMVPVDFAARAIARLALNTRAGALPAAPGPAAPRRVPTFHVSNLNRGERGLVTRQRLMDLLALADLPFAPLGQALRFLPLSDWALEVERVGAPALPVLRVLEGTGPLRRRTSARLFAEAIGEGRDDGIVCPAIDHAYVTRFVRRFYEASRTQPG